jgi:hypothetical protein
MAVNRPSYVTKGLAKSKSSANQAKVKSAGESILAGAKGITAGMSIKSITAKASTLLKSPLTKTLGVGGAIVGGLYAAEQVAEAVGVRGGAGFIGSRPSSSSGGYKRMNYMNVRAARRATRRIGGAVKLLRSIEKAAGKAVPVKRSKQSYGVITRREALGALSR